MAAAVAEILASCGTDAWIVTEVQPQTRETFHQDHRGRPGKDTHYVKRVATRFDLTYRIDDARVAAEASGDGIFPLVTNVADLSELELLHAYKRQPAIEKRFSQASRAIIQKANEIIAEYEAQGFALTLRQIYYQFAFFYFH